MKAKLKRILCHKTDNAYKQWIVKILSKKSKNDDICIPMADSCWCVGKTNTI